MDTTFRSAAALWQRQADAADTLVRLPDRATLARDLPAGACIAVQTGRAWVTKSGDGNDYFVGAGQRHVVARSGRVVIEGDCALTTLRMVTARPSSRPGFP
jgi:hypothetical protein